MEALAEDKDAQKQSAMKIEEATREILVTEQDDVIEKEAVQIIDAIEERAAKEESKQEVVQIIEDDENGEKKESTDNVICAN